MRKKKKNKYRIKWNRIFLCLISVLVVIVGLFFVYFKKNNENQFLDIGYSKSEVVLIKKNLTEKMRKKLLNYSHISYLEELFNLDIYDDNKFLDYIKLIEKDGNDYSIKASVYAINYGIEAKHLEKLDKLIQEDYFILDYLSRYLAYDSDDISEVVRAVNSNLDYDFYTNIEDVDLSKNELMLVNKYYQLPADYSYGDLVTIDSKYDNKTDSKLSKVAYDALKKLVDAAEKEGYYIRNNSAYRSYSYQSGLYNNYKNNNGLVWADKWSARSGHSEHQTGLALDVGVKNNLSLGNFESSKEFTWMKSHSHEYGFILRYPKDKQYITGYGYEPWHYRYVGKDVASYIFEHNITFEEYYAYFVRGK